MWTDIHALQKGIEMTNLAYNERNTKENAMQTGCEPK